MSAKRSAASAFRTMVPITPNQHRISHGSSIVSIGSCFAENIGDRLTDFRFEPLQNPTGVVYNPLSLAASLMRLLKGTPYSPDDTFEFNGCWRCFDYHSRFSAVTQDELLQNINGILSYTHRFLNSLDTLIITLGTAYGYFLKDTDQVVSNCHRLPAKRFDRRLITNEEASRRLSEVLEYLLFLRPSLNVIMTVSPVRHLRDNPHENSISKAHLLCCVENIQRIFPEHVYYFPAYEIMIDELRDYRFYERDMAHPSDLAVDYIWDQFCKACLSDEAQGFVADYEPVRNARNHRIENSSSSQTRQFARTMLEKIDRLEKKHPNIALDDDRDYFNTLL
ncbi:MAG: GSCFA domain-containing protein [Fibrobacterota bacterium]